MSLDILDILFKLDYFVCLLIGFPLNILLIVLIIFKTPKEMKTHSRILIQNCVLDILTLICQLFIQVYYITDTEGNTTMIFPNGILIWFMEEKFNPFLCYIVLVVWIFIAYSNSHGLCVQFIYRYLVLNRNKKINFRRYLFMLSISLFVTLSYILNMFIFIVPFSYGGIKYFDNFNKTWPFIQYKMETINGLSTLPTVLIEISAYLIIFVCGFKMVRYVNLNTNFDGNLKRLNKLLTKVLIILAIVPFVNQAGVIFIMTFSETNNITNIIRIFILINYHLTPVFNPIICILTNTPYRNAIFNRSSQINPQ
uniref:G-protein coupled receptors family 1 profile domain-containing protein n=1 Tax=Meloidogyne enterolobii TaxID=390850 RepID=A0A6V7VI09_MELEN|nr:unnamed protein product [Meloidogyne enterolobii]